MICDKCGKLLPDDAKYCGACGTPLKPEQPKEEKKKSNMIDLTEFIEAVKIGAKTGWSLLRKGWKKLMRWLYVRLSGMTPENDPTVFDVVIALKDFVRQLSGRQRKLFYAGTALAVVLLVCLVGTAVTPRTDSSSGSGGGGGGIWVSNREPYQPEFSKLDCLTCRGDGDCNTCGGYGEVERYAGAGDTVRAKCSSCYGSGNCRTCGGSGKR